MKPTRNPLFPTNSIRYQGSRPWLLAFAAVLTLGSQSAFAQLTWNSAGPSDNWSTAAGNANWNPGGIVWTQNESAVFSVGPEAVNVTTANTFNDITFSISGFSLTSSGGGSLALANDLASTITVTNAPDSASIAENLVNNAGGPSTLTKAGLGTLTLNGTSANTYSGGTIVSAGTLISNQASNIALLGTGAVSITSGATLNLTNTSTTADTTVANAFSNAGSGSITTTSATRAITLTGDMSGFMGTLNIGTTGGGKISVTPSVAMHPSASVNIASGATFFTTANRVFTNSFSLAGFGNTENRGALRIDSGSVISGNIALTADASIGNSGSSASTISGTISGTGFGIRGATTGNQPIILSGSNTFTGKATLAGGNAFSVSSVNNAGNAGNLGTNGTIDFGINATGGTLIYTGAGETTNRIINLAGTTGGGTINQSGSGPFKITGGVTATGAGSKTLTLNGSTAGSGEISGAIADNSGTNKTAVTKDGTGTWTLSGTNTFTGNVTVTTGALVATNSSSLGSGTKTLTLTNGTTGNCNIRLDGSAGAISLPSTFTYTVSNQTSNGALVNAAGNNTVAGQINITSGGGGFLASSLGGDLNISANITSTTTGRAVFLSGPSTGTVSGIISNGSTPGMPLSKDGTGTWTLSNANTYTGSTTVNSGALNLTGSIAGSAIANGGTLKLNFASADTGKLSDAAALTLGGGTLEIAGGTHSEKVLSTTLSTGKISNITRTGGATGFLKLGAVTANPGSQVILDADNIASTTNANVNGILPWARILVAGVPSLATNSGVSDGDGGSFITAFGGAINVDRLGGVIPDNIANSLKIIDAGISGNITLAASPITKANFLEMSAVGGPAIIDPASATDVLMIGDEAGGTVWQSAVAGALTIGTSPNDGILTSGNTESATATALTLLNDSTTNPLTIHSSITNNGTTTPDIVSINKGGAGSVVITGNNSFTGNLTAGSGSLTLSGNNSFTGILAVNNSGTIVTLSGNNSARPAGTTGLTTVGNGATLQLQANGGNTNLGLSTALSGEQTANSPLSLTNGSSLQLRSDSSVTFAGTNNVASLNNATVGIDVDRIGASATTNTLTAAAGVIPIGNAVTLNVTGANGYSLALGTIRSVIGTTTALTLNPTTANLSIAGYHIHNNAANSSTLILSGTSTGNTVSGVIADQGPESTGTTGKAALSKSGTSTWTLNGVNTFTGNTTISAGILAIGDSGNLGSGVYAGTIANAGILNYASSATQSIDGVISGAGTLSSSGTGALRLTATNTYTGPTTITGGTVIAQNNAALGTAAAGTTVSNGGTLDLGGTLGDGTLNVGAEVLTLSGTGVGGNGALVNNGTNNQINATSRIVLAGNATIGGTKRWDLRSGTPTLDMGSFTLTKTGVNTVSLVGVAVSNPGNVIINDGIFSVETTTNVGGSASNAFTVNAGGTLQFYQNSNVIPWSVNLNGATMSQIHTNTTVSGQVALANTGTNTISVTGASLTLSGVVGGTGGFSKTGANLLTLSGANDYDGATTVNAGRLALGNNSALGDTAAATTVANGGQIELNNGVTITGESATISGSGTGAGTGSFRGALQAGNAATATWAGNVILGLADTRIGTQANGVLSVTGVIDDAAETFDLNISADGTNGIVVLSGANTYGGATEIIRGTLRLGATNTLPTGSLLDVDAANGVTDVAILDLASYSQTVSGIQDSATTNVGGTITNSVAASNSVLTVNGTADTTYDGLIQDGVGTVSLTKGGTGIQTLNGANTYTGTTSILGGTLRINGNQSSASGAVSVSNGGTLGGTGTIGAAITVASGGTVAPGVTTGVLIANSADFAPGVKLSIEINEASTPKADTLNVNGALDITGATLEIVPTGSPVQSVHVIATYGTGQLTGTFASVTGLPSKYTIDYAYNGGTQIALVESGYASWAASKGLTVGVNSAPGDDPDNDGQTNIEEFAFDGDPLSGANSGKVVGKIGSVGGSDHMTITLPVRNGAVFSDVSGPEVSASVDGIIYRIEGSDTLAAASWTLNVTEVTDLGEKTAIQTGLPALSSGWTYRTFRAPASITGANPADFLRAGVQ
jgi:fibronectin-binding autotransporter adhesin